MYKRGVCFHPKQGHHGKLSVDRGTTKRKLYLKTNHHGTAKLGFQTMTRGVLSLSLSLSDGKSILDR